MPARSTGLLARGVAALVCAGCVWGILQIAREAPDAAPTAATTPAGDTADCVARKRAEIERLKAAGALTAEQAMIRRQRIARECA